MFSFLDIKKAYVDVFNPGGTTAAKSAVPASEVFGAVPSGGAQMNFFVPQPIADPNAPTDFLTPQTGGTEENSQVRTSVYMYCYQYMYRGIFFIYLSPDNSLF